MDSFITGRKLALAQGGASSTDMVLVGFAVRLLHDNAARASRVRRGRAPALGIVVVVVGAC